MRVATRTYASLAVLALCGGPLLGAQAPVPPPTASPPPPGGSAPCSGPEYRQFDFWIGEWDVTLPDGRTAGRNRIEAALDGCTLVEQWTGAGASRGTSLNAYDATTKRWHQTWVDNAGQVLRLDGGFGEGRMSMQGVAPGADGKPARQRISWTPLAGGRVRQLWESSADEGATWTVVFDGTYARRAK
jgi:hypothetical protein